MGVGDSWGTREQLLHPRDKNGRFRNTWKMAAGVIDKILATLSSFNPKTFTSDEEAANYVRGQARGNRFLTNRGPAIDRFLRDYSKINSDVRAGKPNADAAAIKKGMSPLPDDLILTRVMGPEAFGLDPANVGQIEELTGKLVRDKGFSSTNVGTPMPHQPGAITMSIVAPKGTRALLPSTSRPTREVILDTDQPLRITKVDSDGQGGFYVYAVASGDSHKETDIEIGKAVPGKDVEEVPGGGVPGEQGTGTGAEVAQVPGGGGQPPGGGTGERNDGHVGIVGQGPGAEGGDGEVAPEVPSKPEEGPDTRSTFRDAFDEADIKVPTVGQRRKQFMDAYNGVASGKKTPQEAVNDLDNAISVNKKIIESDKADGTDSGPLVEDVKRQQALSDLIKEHFNFTGRKTQKTPEKKSADVREERLRESDKAEKLTQRKNAEAAGKVDNSDLEGKDAEQLRKIAADEGIPTKGVGDDPEHIAQTIRDLRFKRTQAASEFGKPGNKGPAKKAARTAEQVAADKKELEKKRAEISKGSTEEKSGLLRGDEGFKAFVKKTAPEKKATSTKKAPLSDELNGAYTRTSLAQLRDIADRNGIKVPGDKKTKRDVFEHIVAQLKRKESGGPEVSEKKKPELKAPTPPEKTERDKSPEKKAAPEAPGDIDKMTVAQLRAEAKRQNKRIPGGVTRKADIVEFLKGTDNEKQSKAIREGASKPTSVEIKARLDKMTSREDADKYLRDLNLTVAEQRQLAKDLDVAVPARAKKEDIHKLLVHWGAGRRIDSERISKPGETGRGLDKAAKEAAGEVKAPEKKAPERLTAHMAPGKTNASRVRVGETILVTKDAKGNWVAAKNKTGATPITVTRKDAVKMRARTGVQVHGTDPDGNEISVQPGPSIQTFWKVDKKSEIKAPEKKTVPGKTPAQLKRENDRIIREKAAELAKEERHRKALERVEAKLQKQREIQERREARMKATQDRKVAAEKLAEEKVKARQAERERVAAERVAAREKASADRKAERERLAAEKKKAVEAQKKQVAQTEHEVRVQRKIQDLRQYIGATDKMSMDDLRVWADRNKVKIPLELKTKEQIREHVLRAIAEKEVAQDVERARVPALLRALRKEGIPFLERYKYKSSSAIEEYATKVRKVAADQGIDPQKFKPQGRLKQPVSSAGNGVWSEADWDKVLPRNTDPNHPVRISGWRSGDGYEFEHGVAVRRNGVTYVLETTAEDADNPYHVAMLTEGFDRFHHAIPERGKYQHHYNWFLGSNPADSFWQQRYSNPDHVSLASAGNGRVNVWGQGTGKGNLGKGLKTPFDYNETLNHEFGHNVDRDHSLSAFAQWHDAGRDDWRANVARWRDNRLVAAPLADLHPLTPGLAETRAYPHGISEYGKSSPAEDFAESLAYYFLNVRIAYNQDTGEPFFFEDLFPSRAAYLDALFPRRAKERAALRAAERERLKQLRS